MLRIPLAHYNVNNDRCTNDWGNCIQRNDACFARQDANQIAEQCHGGTAKNSNGK